MKFKKITLFTMAFIGLATAPVFSQEVDIENFESEVFVVAQKNELPTTAVPVPLAVPAPNENYGGVDKLLAIEANPIQTGINDSYYSAYSVRGPIGNSDFQAEFNIAPQTFTGVKFIHVMVLKPLHSTLNIAGRQNMPTTGYTYTDRFRVPAYYYTDVVNQWVDVVFKVDFGTGTSFDRLCIQLDNVSPTNRYTVNTKVYFDEIVVNDTPQPRGDTKVYPTPKTSFPENFEGATTIGDKLFFGNFNYWNTTDADLNLGTPLDSIVTNPEINAINPTSKVLKLSRKKEATWWSRKRFVVNEGAGMTITEANRYAHVMVKKNYDGQVSFFVTSTSGTEYGWISPITNYVKYTWQDLVFKLPDAVLNQTINLVHLLPQSNDITYDLDVYIDEIVFNDSPTPRGAIVTLAGQYDFGGVASGSSKSTTVPFTVTNGGGNIDVVVEGVGFATTTSSFTQAQVQAGANIDLTFSPTEIGKSYTGKAKLMINGSTLREMALRGESLTTNLALNIDFENGAFYSTTPANSTYGGLDAILDICPNPSVGGLNTTAKCAYSVKNIAGGQDLSAEFNIPPVNIVGTKYLHVLVFKPSHSKMNIGLRKNTNPDGANVNIYYAASKYYVSTEGDWADAVFEIKGTGKLVDRISFNIDNCIPTGRFTQNTNLYFDEIVLNDDPQPRGVTSAFRASKNTLPENFEGESSIIDPLYFSQTYNWSTDANTLNWGQALEQVVDNPAPDAINGTTKVLKINRKMDASYYSRISMLLGSTVPATDANRYLHIMVNKPSDGELAVHFWDINNVEAAWVRPIVNYITGEWQDMVFEVPTTFTGDINRIDFNPHTTGATADMNVYIDEIEFSASSDPRYILSAVHNQLELTAKIFSSNGKLVVDGIHEGAQVTIFNSIGKVISQGKASGAKYIMMVNEKFVIVKIIDGNLSTARKVIIK